MRSAADRISELRKARGETQAEFAKIVGVTQPMVSAWEGGGEVPLSAYVRLGNLAPYPDNLWFWEQAGMDEQVMLSSAEKVLKERGAAPGSAEILRIRCKLLTAQGEQDTDHHFIIEGKDVPNPLSTECLIVDESAASQWLPSGARIVVDTSQNDAAERGDLHPFWGRNVLVWRGKLVMGRLRCQQETHPVQHPHGYSVWVATVGPTGDWRAEGEQNHEPVRVGLWEAIPPGELRHPGHTWHPARGSQEHTAHHAQAEKKAPSALRLEWGWKMLGFVIDVRPPAKKVEG